MPQSVTRRQIDILKITMRKMVEASEPFTVPQVTKGIDPYYPDRIFTFQKAAIRTLLEGRWLLVNRTNPNKPLYEVSEEGKTYLKSLYLANRKKSVTVRHTELLGLMRGQLPSSRGAEIANADADADADPDLDCFIDDLLESME